MAKLILSLDGAELREIPLTGSRITIGRKPHNQIVLNNLAVSGEHALLIRNRNEYVLEDRQSTNGTFVNGQPVSKVRLNNHDTIGIARYRLRYVDDTAYKPQAGQFENTVLIAPMSTTSHSDAPRKAVAVAPAPVVTPPPLESLTEPPSLPPQKAQIEAKVVIANGPNAGKELVISKNFVTLGKPGFQVAVISRRPQGFFLTHVEGAQHPIVNGESIGTQAFELSTQDEIELAGIVLRFVMTSRI
ncbi:FHA domain-containing protein [Leeia sp. TBRC 13508]|uniref:FHA domain-containing protein n=1 Tax=Leeia speluncae TaxID=2884804 RepID=A0ABS8D893_9NEIS|nr:FHA domain-containing protein [Leeia speluncae]MCB6183858.1 FHA domain-containing protein [Leeia speluncae]